MEDKKKEIKLNPNPLTFWDGLALLFIALKLCGVIDWEWKWVLAPIWGYIAFLGIVSILLGSAVAFSNYAENKNGRFKL